ncbi:MULTISPECIES: DUF4260 family protein [Streptomyces]|uniref:DUF4260 family protein n=1 Tax=Streptomyces xanthii TaxID=2768069 RepID=A0A7H1BBE3_9ACTN|nr:DUF4260 family protein [Streptomyces xanthii]QNS06048.1 DUF4260 family protein [Streptomyces xanthii]
MAADLRVARPVPRPAPVDRWTWRHPEGRLLSAAVGAAAFTTGLALGGAVSLPFWAALIAPDLAFLHRGKTPPAGPGHVSPDTVRLYNTLHDPRLAAGTVAAGALTASPALLLAGLGWTTHIAVDRAFGFGTRRPDGAIH